MRTDGGGWTLGWSYMFTNYDDFTSVANAVTPRHNWPVHGCDGISTTGSVNIKSSVQPCSKNFSSFVDTREFDIVLVDTSKPLGSEHC